MLRIHQLAVKTAEKLIVCSFLLILILLSFITVSATEPVTENVTELVTEASTESVTELVTEASTESVTELVTEQSTELNVISTVSEKDLLLFIVVLCLLLLFFGFIGFVV